MLDVQVLLADILQRERAWILTHPEARLSEEQRDRYLEALQACQKGQALPHVLGWWEFFGRRFLCPPEVLIPRPETELMVERALEVLMSLPASAQVVDVGTGSGCVAVTLAAESPSSLVYAVDIEQAALRVTRQNALAHGVGKRVKPVRADLLRGLVGPFDLICANLPYIPSDELGDLQVVEREPRRALDGGVDGLEVVRRFIAMIPSKVSSSASVFVEIGAEQAQPLMDWIGQSFESVHVDVARDLAGRQRLLCMTFGEDS